MNPTLERSEIQGLLASGYAKQRAAGYLLLRVVDRTAAAGWLRGLLGCLTCCGDKTTSLKVNIAFSYQALSKFLDCEGDLAEFSREFREGMVTPHRQRALGDLPGSASDPEHWQWGGPRHGGADILLLVYETTPAALESALLGLRMGFAGVELERELHATALRDGREHFGFHDGIAQPFIQGLGRPGSRRDQVAAGEFILGYEDEAGLREPAPAWATNGSYLVLRQIAQDVPGFWNSLRHLPEPDRIAIAAKMVGRWPDGTPLTLAPSMIHEPLPTNDFVFQPDDRDGSRCPFGAHIRRVNPRDSLSEDGPASMKMVNRHRILRRGRPFGLPLAPPSYPEGCVVESEDRRSAPAEELRGIYFIGLNASLARQFEFVQQTWMNNPKFHGLSAETDPVASQIRWAGRCEPSSFTMQGQPLRRRILLPDSFVRILGGEYFFLPGRAALKYVASFGRTPMPPGQ